MDDAVPPMYQNPPPVRSTPPRRRGRGWLIALGLVVGLLALLAVSGVFRLASSFSTATSSIRTDGRYLEEVVVENNHSRNKIAMIDIKGIISSEPVSWSGQSLVEFIRDQFRVIADDEQVRAVILRIDSPGGEVLASDDIYREVELFQQATQKPVVASMGSLAASGGYYVAAPCRWIVANELTITGSIGVILQSLNFHGLLDKVGVTPVTFKSGEFKDMLSPVRPPGEVGQEERRMVQSLIDETYERFRSVVGSGRAEAASKNEGQGRELVNNWKEYADGRVFSGKQAFQWGFVDELGGFETAVQRAQTLAGIRTANLIRYEEPVGLGSFLRLFGQSEASSLKIDWGMEVPKLPAGRLYFISSTLIH